MLLPTGFETSVTLIVSKYIGTTTTTTTPLFEGGLRTKPTTSCCKLLIKRLNSFQKHVKKITSFLFICQQIIC